MGLKCWMQQKIENYSFLGLNNEYNKNLENIKKEIAVYKLCEINDRFPKYVFANKESSELMLLIDQNDTSFHRYPPLGQVIS
jgi:hypothetical protein